MSGLREYWVFGYGSLMWRPGFDHVQSEPALIRGYHRALCVLSFVHRGTSENPGLVLGLDRGGSCHGMAFRVEEARWDEALAYLRSREQVTMVYLEAKKPVVLKTSGRTVEATTYLIDRSHRQYAGKLAAPELLRLVRQGQGISGNCIDYVFNTIAHLRDMKIHDARLEALGDQLTAQAAASAGIP
ncbi:MAG: gamma-glutamylcyclotransferase [Rhizobiales bacterium]|nr:gamma-glutamylcyclotransferase [Hyphomicrobiales bacterium]